MKTKQSLLEELLVVLQYGCLAMMTVSIVGAPKGLWNSLMFMAAYIGVTIAMEVLFIMGVFMVVLAKELFE